MSLIKGKQIQSLQASKIVESTEKRFVNDAQITLFTGKAETSDVEAAKTEATEALTAAKGAISGEISTAKTEANSYTDTAVSEAKGEATKALAAARIEITSEVGAAKDGAITDAKAYTDAEATKLNEKVVGIGNNATTALQERYTKAEVDQKLAQLGAGIKYKGTVASYEEIAIKFPEPGEGWLVAVEGTRKFYVYDEDTVSWEEFPIEIRIHTTYAKTIQLTVTDSQTVIKTGIKTNGEGASQSSPELAQEVILCVGGIAQAKSVDYTVAVVSDEIEITWKSADFALEASDVVTLTYNQTA